MLCAFTISRFRLRSSNTLCCRHPKQFLRTNEENQTALYVRDGREHVSAVMNYLLYYYGHRREDKMSVLQSYTILFVTQEWKSTLIQDTEKTEYTIS